MRARCRPDPPWCPTRWPKLPHKTSSDKDPAAVGQGAPSGAYVDVAGAAGLRAQTMHAGGGPTAAPAACHGCRVPDLLRCLTCQVSRGRCQRRLSGRDEILPSPPPVECLILTTEQAAVGQVPFSARDPDE